MSLRKVLALMSTAVFVVMVAMPGTATAADYFDDFELYSVGSFIQGQGNFIYWLDLPDPDSHALVSDVVAYSGTKSLMLGGHAETLYTDPVWQFADVVTGVSPVNSGPWIQTQMSYIPSTSTTAYSEWNYMSGHPVPDWGGDPALVRRGSSEVLQETGTNAVPADRDAGRGRRCAAKVDENGCRLRSTSTTGAAGCSQGATPSRTAWHRGRGWFPALRNGKRARIRS